MSNNDTLYEDAYDFLISVKFFDDLLKFVCYEKDAILKLFNSFTAYNDFIFQRIIWTTKTDSGAWSFAVRGISPTEGLVQIVLLFFSDYNEKEIKFLSDKCCFNEYDSVYCVCLINDNESVYDDLLDLTDSYFVEKMNDSMVCETSAINITKSPISILMRLLHDFITTDPRHMYFKLLSNGLDYYLSTKEGQTELIEYLKMLNSSTKEK
ncbi:MAG: hypothetical protein IKF64_03645 [Eubacterium sp.]|nr:hypothetical protein [Eubacterium sp.]